MRRPTPAPDSPLSHSLLPYVGRLGSEHRHVGRIGSEVQLSASFQKNSPSGYSSKKVGLRPGSFVRERGSGLTCYRSMADRITWTTRPTRSKVPAMRSNYVIGSA